jgi:enediyne polyketide synthase
LLPDEKPSRHAALELMNPSIAIVGMACVYPDARTPGELWENVLAQRRAFRRLPPERLRLEDYFSADPRAPDATYATQAAVIEGYEFDRIAFRIAGSTFRAADLVHWLALDVVSRALADAGLADGNGLPREATGVLLGNTLTGEFSRANALRLRWPYVRRVLDAALAKEAWAPERREPFLAGLEAQYKSPFPPVNEETLAGSLSNTIAGRICNQFDLKGGGYTVDGACASSLLAVASACSSLAAGDLDVAIAGGVDLSLDPFEMVGFAKAGALAPDEMRVFDKRSAGFWPGEGCGMVVLMRHEDALAQGRRAFAAGAFHPMAAAASRVRKATARSRRSGGRIAARALGSRPSPTAKGTAPAPPSGTPRRSRRCPGRGARPPPTPPPPPSVRSRPTSATRKPPPASPA